MSDVVSNKDIQAINNNIEKMNNDIDGLSHNVEEIVTTLQDFIHHIDERFNKVETEIVDLKDSHNRLLNAVDAFVARLDKNELENATGDYQFRKLLSWAKNV